MCVRILQTTDFVKLFIHNVHVRLKIIFKLYNIYVSTCYFGKGGYFKLTICITV